MYYYQFGCEFEFSTLYSEMMSRAKKSIKQNSTKKLITRRNKHHYYQSNNNKTWHLKTDSSTECEICTPVSKFSNIQEICNVISCLEDVDITKKDSFHIHCEVGDIPIPNIIVSWITIENIIFNCFPKHRRNIEPPLP